MRYELWIKLNDGSEKCEQKNDNKWILANTGHNTLNNNPNCVEAWLIDTKMQERIDIEK